MKKYEIVGYKVWECVDGRTASIHGGVPYTSPSEKNFWKIVVKGYTVYNPKTGQYGIGKPPCKTLEEAQILVERLGNPNSVGIGY